MVIETQKLTKLYGNKKGCSEVSIKVEEGSTFGFLGPNGAGKSTFIKMLVGLLHPTSGTATVLGKPAGDVLTRKKIGYLPENFKYHDWMTGVDLLSFHASLYNMDRKAALKRIPEVIETVKLTGNEKYRIGTYSKGMQQRIGIASAILSEPELIFLDEPTSALDPIGRKEVREIILDLKKHGKTVLLNSHLLSEVEMVCDSVAIINNGCVIEQASMNELRKGKINVEMEVSHITEEIAAIIRSKYPDTVFRQNSILLTADTREELHELASLILNSNIRLYSLVPKQTSLESIFINLVEGGR